MIFLQPIQLWQENGIILKMKHYRPRMSLEEATKKYGGYVKVDTNGKQLLIVVVPETVALIAVDD